MAKIERLSDVAQTEIIVIPIIDVSGSMDGDRIGSVNEAMREVPKQLAKINEDSVDAKLLIAPMEFSSGARWFALKNDQPAEVELFRWIDMQASGVTDFGAALELLTEKLTTEDKDGWMKGRGGAAPVLILFSDGYPSDDYEKKLEELQKRGWFNAALKFAVAVGADADADVLAKFTGNKEAVIKTEVVRTRLASIVKAVILSASRTASSFTTNLNTNSIVADSGLGINAQAQQEAVKSVKKALTLDDTDDLF